MTNETLQQTTEKQVRHAALQAIAKTSIEPWKYYHLCWWEGRLQCLHIHHTKEPHPSFYAANGHVFTDGLNVNQWRLITSRVVDFCQRQGITLCKRRELSDARGTNAAREKLQITDFDSRRLRDLIDGLRLSGASTVARLDKLERTLESARIVAPEEVPADVVTMNSRVRLRDHHRDEEMTCALVFPPDVVDDRDSTQRNVSVLSLVGVSLLGRQVGHTVAGRLRVDEMLYQPEAAGDFHL